MKRFDSYEQNWLEPVVSVNTFPEDQHVVTVLHEEQVLNACKKVIV